MNGQLAQLVARLGDEAPEVARYFVGSDEGFYVKQLHPVDLLVRDAEKLRTQWATGRRVVPKPQSGGGETTWQRSQRERVAEMTGGLVSRRVDQELEFAEVFDAPRRLG